MSAAGKDSRTELSPPADGAHMELSFPLSLRPHRSFNPRHSASLEKEKEKKQTAVSGAIKSDQILHARLFC